MAFAITQVLPNIAFQGEEAAVTNTTTALEFSGTGVVLIPKASGTVRITLHADVSNNTISDGVTFNVNYAAGTALTAAGTAAAGTAALATAKTYTALIAAQVFPASLVYEITGLTVNTSYTFQPVYAAVTAGTASFTQTDIWAEEL